MDNPTNRLLALVVVILTVVATVSLTLHFNNDTQTAASGGLDANAAPSEVENFEVNPEVMEKLIGDYLAKHPEVIVSAFEAVKVKQERLLAERAGKTIQTKIVDLEKDPRTPYVGNGDADVTIVKFSDYNCGYCKRVVPDLITLLKEDKNVKLVVKDFPILGPQSIVSSKAAIVAGQLSPEKWWKFHTGMLKSSPRNEAQVLAIAEKAGYDVEAFKAEMKKPWVDNQIQKNMKLGTEIGIRGTPAFVIGGELKRGAIGLSDFREAVAKARADKS